VIRFRVTKVKICGLTRRQDIESAVALGVDALGFIAVPESKRFVTPGQVHALLPAVPPFVSTVVVALEGKVAEKYPVAVHQLYSTTEELQPLRTIRVFRLRDRSVAREALAWPGPVLLDAHVEGMLGGSGKTVDWDLAAEVTASHPFPVVLAGGLEPGNVGEAIRRVRPYAVDVSSGVESSPGVKDPDRMRDFLSAVRDASAP